MLYKLTKLDPIIVMDLLYLRIFLKYLMTEEQKEPELRLSLGILLMINTVADRKNDT